METITLHTRLKIGKEKEYDTVHHVIPSELALLLRQHGVKSWRIYRKDRDIFHTVECINYKKLLVEIEHHPINVAWQKRMAELAPLPRCHGRYHHKTVSFPASASRRLARG